MCAGHNVWYLLTMNEIERRTLIGAAGIGAIAALSKAGGGPLNPPAGSVAGTGRTLDEVYNKIPVIGGSDGRSPVGISPFTLGAPGSYVLTANLVGAGTVLTITGSNVTLDLNGFSIISTSSSVTALQISGALKNVTIRNGSVDGGSSCISTNSTLTDSLIEDVRVSNGKIAGINIGGGSSRGCVVRRCVVCSTGSTTVAADGNLGIAGIIVGGSSSRVDECVISRMFYNGGGVVTFRGISFNAGAGTGNIASRCTISHDALLAASGITFAGSGIYRDNTVSNFTVPYSGGTNGGGNI